MVRILGCQRNDIMKLVPDGRRQSTSQTHVNSKVIERLYILKKELQQQERSGEQKTLAVNFREHLHETQLL